MISPQFVKFGAIARCSIRGDCTSLPHHAARNRLRSGVRTMMNGTRLSLSAVLVAFFSIANVVAAQCPDGTPPPCNRTATTIASTRRANPALNDRAWIVVPFTNATRAPDLDWLRDASVNLLSLDLSRWTDLTVIDDKRVTDLLRELPPAKIALPLSLSDGLALARRAGAGKLVMGDYFKLGKGARVTANVFDVKTGARLRSATSQASDADSLLTAFGPLARGVLDVAPPPDAKLGLLGTSRLDAYQEYLLGVGALNRIEMDDAQLHLTRAVTLDSMFALAHWKLAVAYSWGSVGTANFDSLKSLHIAAANQLGVNLPERPRALIAAEFAADHDDPEKACRILLPLVLRDSSDVEALENYGECSINTHRVIPSDSNPTIGRFVTSWSRGLWAFRRALQVDPRFLIAYSYLLQPSRSYGQRYGCIAPTPGVFCSSWQAALLPSGDSLIAIPVDVERNPAALHAQEVQATRERARLVMFREVKRDMQAWVEAAPKSSRAHYQLARILNEFGETQAAEAQLRQVDDSHDRELFLATPQWRTDFAIKLGHGTEARVWFDSIIARAPDRPNLAWRRGSWNAVFGRFARFSKWVDQDTGRTAAERAFMKQLPSIMLGASDTSVTALERAWFNAPQTATCGSRCREERIIPSLAYGLRLPRAVWPALSDSSKDVRLLPAKAMAAHDTAALRSAALELERQTLEGVRALDSDVPGYGLVAVDAFVMLGDSTHALNLARFWVDSAMTKLILFSSLGDNWPGAPVLWPRAMLQRADLAAALGFREEARVWYAKLLDLWAEADAELQPLVARIRVALLKLGPAK